MMRLLRWWVGLWDRREAGTSLALVRILLGMVVLIDLLQIVRFDLAVPFFAPLEHGGLAAILDRPTVPWLYRWFEPGPGLAWGALWVAIGAAACTVLGLGTRVAVPLLLALLAVLSLPVPPADRGIDMLVRNALLVLSFSRCGAALSLDALVLRRRLVPDVLVPSWPRYLLGLQLVVLYTAAGMNKVATLWLPPDWSALFVAMRDPAFGRIDYTALLDGPLFHLTRALTAVTWTWEWAALVLPLLWWWRDTPDRGGRLRTWSNRVNLLWWYLLIGGLFHLGTHLTMRLGIFPFAVMSLYPAAAHPDELARLWRRVVGRLRPAV
ncbi:MAG: HTTM domain-containing protein [Alphaproteobacteria bacterium]|nr:HTTM domain-containing protein [Alphaproteobacteria bacterium]